MGDEQEVVLTAANEVRVQLMLVPSGCIGGAIQVAAETASTKRKSEASSKILGELESLDRRVSGGCIQAQKPAADSCAAPSMPTAAYPSIVSM